MGTNSTRDYRRHVVSKAEGHAKKGNTWNLVPRCGHQKGAIVTYLVHFHDILWGIVDTLDSALDGLGLNTVRCKSLRYGIGGSWGLQTR